MLFCLFIMKKRNKFKTQFKMIKNGNQRAYRQNNY